MVGGLMVLSLSLSAEKRDAKTGLLVPMPSGCDPETDSTTGCCARRVLSQQQDFWEQKGQLREEAEAAYHLSSLP